MGLLKTRRAAGTKPARAMTAAGIRLDGMSTDALRAIAGTRQDWQAHAWGYRDAIGELRGGVQFLARAVSRVQFLPAEVNPAADEPIPFDSDEATVPPALQAAAQEELGRLPLGSGYSFLGVMVENLSIPGECWLHGYYDQADAERWVVRSTDEVDVSLDGRMSIKEGGTGTKREANVATLDNPDGDEELLRLWVPHPRYRNLADSPMRALLDVCEEIVLSGMELRAASRSRVMANGILLVPEGLTLLNALVQDRDLASDEAFMADLQATLLAPIGNEGEAGAVVPAVIKGNAEDLEKIRHLTLERTTSAELLDRLERCLKRLGSGMDIPPELISGMADVNHWTAWQIDHSTFRHHIEPMVRIVGDALTEGFLRPALLVRGFSPQDVARVQVWHDAGNLTENPNRGEDAKAAFDRGALGFAPLLEALGFSKADLPDDDEMARIVAMKTGVDSTVAAAILAGTLGNSVPQPQVIDAAPARPALPPADDDRPAGGSPGNAPTRTAPAGANSLHQRARGIDLAAALVAAAAAQNDPAAGWTVDVELSRELVNVDRALRDRLLVAADAAMSRALEKAGSRARSYANRQPKYRVALAECPDVTRMVAHLGRDALYALGTTEQDLLAGAFDALRERFELWTLSAVERVAAVLARLLGYSAGSDQAKALTDRLTASMTARLDAGWSRLRDGLLRLAEKYLYSPDPDETPGEHSGTLVPTSLVRAALAEVAGLPPGSSGLDDDGLPVDKGEPLAGLGTGADAQEVLAEAGADRIGFEWAYGVTPMPRRFDPHWELNGRRFTGWTDAALKPTEKYAWVGDYYTPGDHTGCMCDYVPLYAVPDYAAQISERLGEDTPYMRDERTLAEGDDAAGRRGTTAQATRDERDRILALQRRYIVSGGNQS